MEKQYNVAFFGIKPAKEDAVEYEDMVPTLGIRTYNSLSSDKIIDIVQNTHRGMLDDKLFGLTVDKHQYQMYGGRFIPPFTTREEMAELMKNINVLIVSGCVDFYHSMSYVVGLSEILSKDCIVVLRMAFTKDELPFSGMNTKRWLNGLGFSDRKLKKNKKKSASTNNIYVVGMSEYGYDGMSPEEGISLLQSRLSVGMVDKVLGPVKETGSAGKSLMDWGRQWISKLIHSN
jgi:hypothetical protein